MNCAAQRCVNVRSKLCFFLLLPTVLPLMLSTFHRVGVHHCLFQLGVGVHRSLFVHLQTCLPSDDPTFARPDICPVLFEELKKLLQVVSRTQVFDGFGRLLAVAHFSARGSQ